MEPYTSFLFGSLGGLLINVVRLAELANVPRIERPPTFSDPLYVFQFFALPLVGGALAYAYEPRGEITIPMNPLLALNIGISAPLILKTLAQAIPQKIRRVD